MPEKDTDELLPDREHYRELARQVREVARLVRFPYARGQLIRLAASLSIESAISAGTRTRGQLGMLLLAGKGNRQRTLPRRPSYRTALSFVADYRFRWRSRTSRDRHSRCSCSTGDACGLAGAASGQAIQSGLKARLVFFLDRVAELAPQRHDQYASGEVAIFAHDRRQLLPEFAALVDYRSHATTLPCGSLTLAYRTMR